MSYDIRLACDGLRALYITAIPFCMSVVFALGVAVTNHWVLVLIFPAILFANLVTHRIFERQMNFAIGKLRESMYMIGNEFQCQIMLHPLISSLSSSRTYDDRLKNRMGVVTGRRNANLRLFAKYSACLELEYWAALSCIIGVGAYLCFNGIINIGNMVASVMVMERMAASISALMMVIPQIDMAKESMSAMQKDIESSESLKGESNFSRGGGVVFRNVSFDYSNRGMPIFKELNLEFKKPEKVLIIGRNGCGKSTILKLIAGMLTPKSGCVDVESKNVAMIPQDAVVCADSVLENVRLRDESISHQKVLQVVIDCGLGEFVANLPKGVYTHVTNNTLSGGQKQLLLIARALVREPQIVLVDEITNNLDIVSKKKILDVLWRVNKERLVLFVSHELEVAKVFDRILIVDTKGVRELSPRICKEDLLMELCS